MQILDTSVSRRALLSGAAAMALPLTFSVSAARAEERKPEREVDMAEVLKPGPLPEMALGPEDAPVKIVEYMSMTCSHCANFHTTTFETIKQKYIDTGKVRFILREFPFDLRATAAFMLARCAPKEQFFPFVGMLLKQQATWAGAQDARGALLQMSRMAGFSEESFNACLTNNQLQTDVLAVFKNGSEKFGITATPTFIINGKVYSGDMSVDEMSAIIDAAA